MGKNLTYNESYNENTRLVLIEKSELYFYKFERFGAGIGLTGMLEQGGACMEECAIKKTKIGSVNCQECVYNKAYHNNKNYIICSKIKQATSNG